MIRKYPIGVMYSGGKDSTYACAKLLEDGYDISCLITVLSDNKESYMLHTSNIELTRLSSEALNIPLVIGHTKGRKEEELEDIKQTVVVAIKDYGIKGLGTGAIASVYQKSRIDAIGSNFHLPVISPLWGTDQKQYLRKLIADRYRFIVTSVSCEGLDNRWLGHEVTMEDVEELDLLSARYKFNIAFEGGEAETLVLDCPLFERKKIRIVNSEVLWNGYFGSFNIKSAVLENKLRA